MQRNGTSGRSKGNSKGSVSARTRRNLHGSNQRPGRSKKRLRALEELRVSHAAKKAEAEAAQKEFTAKKIEQSRRTEKKQALVTGQAGLVRQRDGLVKRLDDLSAQEQEFKTLEGQVAGYPDKKQQLDTLRVQKTEFDRLTGEQKFLLRECADLAARVNTHKEQCARLDKDTEKAAVLREECRAALKVVGIVPDSWLDSLATSKIAEVAGTLGTLSAQQKRLESDRTKLLADRDTIKAAGADGTCPLCRQKLGTHYPEIEKEFEARLAEIQDEACTRPCRTGKTLKRKAGLDTYHPETPRTPVLCRVAKRREALDTELAELLEAVRKKRRPVITSPDRLLPCTSILPYLPPQKKRSPHWSACRCGTRARPQLAQAGEVKPRSGRSGTDQGKRGGAQRGRRSHCAVKFDPAEGTRLDAQLSSGQTAGTVRPGPLAPGPRSASGTQKKRSRRSKKSRKNRRIRAADRGCDRRDRTPETDPVHHRRVRDLCHAGRAEPDRGRSEPDHPEITGGRYEQVLLDEDFNLLVRDVDNDYAIDRFSGGEQDDIAVALRIALSRYLPSSTRSQESTLLIFDEIFGSQDEERRNNLLTALRTQESRFPQILLISHIPDIQGEFANTLIVEMGTDHSSQVRVVE